MQGETLLESPPLPPCTGCLVPNRCFFNLFWDTSCHGFSSLPKQPTPVLNRFVKLNTFKFSLFYFILIQTYTLCSIFGEVVTKSIWSFTFGKDSKTNYKSSGRSCCLGPGLTFIPWCEEIHATFLNSNCMHEKWAQSPAQKWLPLPVENTDYWAGLMCRCLQPQAKLQHHLEAGLALPSEWACFPEHLSD